jgi:hypothetical protein
MPTLSQATSRNPEMSIFSWGMELSALLLMFTQRANFLFLDRQLSMLLDRVVDTKAEEDETIVGIVSNVESVPLTSNDKDIEEILPLDSTVVVAADGRRSESVLLPRSSQLSTTMTSRSTLSSVHSKRDIVYCLSLNRIGFHIAVAYSLALSIVCSFDSGNFGLLHNAGAFSFFVLSLGHCFMCLRVHFCLRRHRHQPLHREPKLWICVTMLLLLLTGIPILFTPNISYGFAALIEYCFLSTVLAYWLSLHWDFKSNTMTMKLQLMTAFSKD